MKFIMNEDQIDSIFAGNLDDDLPKLSTKLVRIFTSSTFTDMLMERKTLMEFVYPKIKSYCREKHGIEFQVVDIRLGLREEMTNDHLTTELCMTELRNCQELSIGPNFIYFGGQKYGYRPIPTVIPTEEINALRGTLLKMQEDVSLLDKWYVSDTNHVPPLSILQPIDTHLKHFLNKKEPGLQAEDAAAWWVVQSKLQGEQFSFPDRSPLQRCSDLLRKASKALLLNDEFSEEQKHNYFMSVTEREVINGCISPHNVKVNSKLILPDLRPMNIFYPRITSLSTAE